MKLRRPSVRPPPETIIALIDVVFFLLVFFMLIGRMDATAPFEVSPPRSVTGSDMPAGGVTVSVSREGALALDGAPIARGDLIAAIGAQAQAEPTTRIRINAHQDTELRQVLPLVSEFEAMGLLDVGLVVTPEGT